MRILYNSTKNILPIHSIECTAKLAHSLWIINLASFFPDTNLKPPVFTIFSSPLISAYKKTLLDEKETSAVLISRSQEPLFFQVMANEFEQAVCCCLLKTQQSNVYLHIYAKKGCCFTSEHAEFISLLVTPICKELRRSFVLPSPFTGVGNGQRANSALSLLQICPDMKDVEAQVRQIAPTGSLVLITGESGVGKDLVAKTIHELSPRHDNPFVKVNCGAIPDTLLDSELFGYEKGAFTGAEHAQSGYFEQAEGGTIFLDEIGELSLAAQVRLLHVLENGQIQRVGSHETKKVNIRVIAATNKDLWGEVERGAFREDLCYRLFVCHVHVPPLRERKNDIPVLIWYFLNLKAEHMNIPPKVQILEDEIRALCAYDWPGNVRELEHTIERSLIYSGDSPVLNIKIHTYRKKHPLPPPQSAEWPTLDEYMTDYMRRVLEHTGGRIKGPQGAAALLRINPHTLRSRLIKYGLLHHGRGS